MMILFQCVRRQRRREASSRVDARARAKRVLVLTRIPFRRFVFRRAEEEFLAFGPMTRVTRDYRLEESLEDVQRLSGSQILRRTVADLMGVLMHEKEKAVDAREFEGGGASETEAEAEAEAETSSAAKTVDGLYKKLLPLVAAELHSRLAHELVQSGFVRRTGAVPGVTLMKKSKEYIDPRTVVVEDPFRMMDPDDAPKTDEERRLVSATLRAHRLINADRDQSRARGGGGTRPRDRNGGN